LYPFVPTPIVAWNVNCLPAVRKHACGGFIPERIIEFARLAGAGPSALLAQWERWALAVNKKAPASGRNAEAESYRKGIAATLKICDILHDNQINAI
jgi:hypothetical protein